MPFSSIGRSSSRTSRSVTSSLTAHILSRNAGPCPGVHPRVKHIGFLSFGHWSASPGSQVRTGSDALLQSIELAVAAEELGADGAYFRVHHFARQLASPFPLLAAAGAKT